MFVVVVAVIRILFFMGIFVFDIPNSLRHFKRGLGKKELGKTEVDKKIVASITNYMYATPK